MESFVTSPSNPAEGRVWRAEACRGGISATSHLPQRDVAKLHDTKPRIVCVQYFKDPHHIILMYAS